MTLDPRERKSWQGFLDLLQAPPGYRLSAALGTSFGLSLDALTAALLAMSDADGEAMAAEPVAGVMAITRLRHKVRVLVHPATIAGSAHAGASRFVALLDRMIVEVQPSRGLFHPKVWALRFDRIANASSSLPAARGRVIVASRNLSTSTSFELGAVFEGIAKDDEDTSPFGADVARALRTWIGTSKTAMPDAVRQLPGFVRSLAFDCPHDAADALRLRWQGPGGQALSTHLPHRLDRAVVVSPFVRPDFVSAILDRTRELQLVSTPEALNALDDTTFARLEAVGQAQGSPVLYQVAALGDPDNGHVEGLHAKLLLAEGEAGDAATFVGSANATAPGWGLSGFTNVEAMVEMRPGIGIDRFVSGFLRKSKAEVHPWVTEYDRTARTEADARDEAERRMLVQLRQVAKLDLVLRYDTERQRLTLARTKAGAANSTGDDEGADVTFDVSPLLIAGRTGSWTPIAQLDEGAVEYSDVPLESVTAFVALRGRCAHPPIEMTRLVLARLDMSEAALDRRDEAVRQDVMATADPAAVLGALVRGLAYLVPGSSLAGPRDGRTGTAIKQLLGQTTLEGLLRAIAAEPGLLSEMRLLLGPASGPEFSVLCDDLEAAIKRVRVEASS